MGFAHKMPVDTPDSTIEQGENTLDGTQAFEFEEADNKSCLSYQDDLASLPDEFAATTFDKEDRMSNIGGGMLMTWGTGFQKGLKLAYSPSRTADKLTVATDHCTADYQSSVLSNASTGFYSRECRRLEQAVMEQRDAREKLEADVAMQREAALKNQELLRMKLTNNNAKKLMITDQRNMLPSSENYMRHP
jgi:hypothetical protein